MRRTGRNPVQTTPRCPDRRQSMDAAYLSALSALAGSAVGGLTMALSAWISQSVSAKAGLVSSHLARRQELFRNSSSRPRGCMATRSRRASQRSQSSLSSTPCSAGCACSAGRRPSPPAKSSCARSATRLRSNQDVRGAARSDRRRRRNRSVEGFQRGRARRDRNGPVKSVLGSQFNEQECALKSKIRPIRP